MSVELEKFGDRSIFAFEVGLLDDPDPVVPAKSVGSWGQWRLWVAGQNLSAFRRSEYDGVQHDVVTWYLAPLFRWLAEAWTPLLHEQRLPGAKANVATARAAYQEAVALWLADVSGAFRPWQSWAQRHALRTASEGAVLPDVFLRRLGDDIEVSWGDRPVPGGEDVVFRVEAGVAELPVRDVAASLDAALAWFLRQPSLAGQPWFAELHRLADARAAQAANHRSWFLDGSPEPSRITHLLDVGLATLADRGVALARPAPPQHHASIAFAPAVAMFGAVSPELSEAAAVSLLVLLAEARDETNAPRAIDDLVETLSAAGTAYPWDDGYRLALLFLDEVEGAYAFDALPDRLGVRCRDASLGPGGPRGVALAGSGIAPTIVLNTEHPSNQGDAGRRFTIAHELCHLLYDRGLAKRVMHTSTPWAPLAVEQRANAFAAMLLMPPARLRDVLRAEATISLPALRDVARELRVGVQALIRHLANLGMIGFDQRTKLLAEYRSERRAA